MSPFETTLTGSNLLTNAYKIQGNGSPTQTSKILDPTEEDTAMSPRPFLATITEVIKSGMEVPAAKKVSPIIYIKETT